MDSYLLLPANEWFGDDATLHWGVIPLRTAVLDEVQDIMETVERWTSEVAHVKDIAFSFSHAGRMSPDRAEEQGTILPVALIAEPDAEILIEPLDGATLRVYPRGPYGVPNVSFELFEGPDGRMVETEFIRPFHLHAARLWLAADDAVDARVRAMIEADPFAAAKVLRDGLHARVMDEEDYQETREVLPHVQASTLQPLLEHPEERVRRLGLHLVGHGTRPHPPRPLRGGLA